MTRRLFNVTFDSAGIIATVYIIVHYVLGGG